MCDYITTIIYQVRKIGGFGRKIGGFGRKIGGFV